MYAGLKKRLVCLQLEEARERLVKVPQFAFVGGQYLPLLIRMLGSVM